MKSSARCWSHGGCLGFGLALTCHFSNISILLSSCIAVNSFSSCSSFTSFVHVDLGWMKYAYLLLWNLWSLTSCVLSMSTFAWPPRWPSGQPASPPQMGMWLPVWWLNGYMCKYLINTVTTTVLDGLWRSHHVVALFWYFCSSSSCLSVISTSSSFSCIFHKLSFSCWDMGSMVGTIISEGQSVIRGTAAGPKRFVKT